MRRTFLLASPIPHHHIHLPMRKPTPDTLFALSAASIAALSLAFLHPRSPYNYRTMTSSTSSANLPSTFPTRPYKPRHTAWPYNAFDMQPSDPTSDVNFYSSPRFVTHIDDHAIGLLRRYYGSILPTPAPASSTSTPTPRPRVLDLCSSWISHYPTTLETTAKSGADTGLDIAGLGMNAAELRANPLFGGKDARARWMVRDSNAQPELPALRDLYKSETSASGEEKERGIRTTTLTVSIDYLTRPVAVLQSLLQNTEPGGSVHLAISNRCFPTKAVGRWLRVNEEERLQMVGDYLWFAGWRDVEIVELSDGTVEEEEGAEQGQGGSLKRFMGMMCMSPGGCDPLWVVRARKVDGVAEGGKM